MEIVFYEQNGAAYHVTSDTPNLLPYGSFAYAECRKGQCIIYTYENYNADDQTPRTIKTLLPGSGKTSIGFTPRSVRSVPTFGSEGATLYQHNNYSGLQIPVFGQDANLKFGVSSMIISAGRWQLYTKDNFVGSFQVKGPGEYPDPQSMGVPNDQLKSIKLDD